MDTSRDLIARGRCNVIDCWMWFRRPIGGCGFRRTAIRRYGGNQESRSLGWRER